MKRPTETLRLIKALRRFRLHCHAIGMSWERAKSEPGRSIKFEAYNLMLLATDMMATLSDTKTNLQPNPKHYRNPLK